MNNNHECLICLGSNKDADIHLKVAQNALMHLFQKVAFGNRVITKAEGPILQPDYVNLAARIVTSVSCDEVKKSLKQIEIDNGRTPEDKQMGSVPLDIDLLTYDSEVLRPEDLEKNYVKQALKSL